MQVVPIELTWLYRCIVSNGIHYSITYYHVSEGVITFKLLLSNSLFSTGNINQFLLQIQSHQVWAIKRYFPLLG